MTKFYKTASTLTKSAKTLPGKYYISNAIFQAEIERIFSSRWLCIGREELLPNAGDYFLRQVGAESIIVVRTRSGDIRAFYNVCRHRGTRLCTEERGNFNTIIVCPYHAWGYSLDGQLAIAPLTEELDDFRLEDYPLFNARIATWEGFIFLNLAESPTPFATAFAPIMHKFSQWHLPKLRVLHRIEYQVQANWKLIFQNYSECYHCPPVHPTLVKMSPYRGGQNDLFSGPFLGGFMTINQVGGSLTLSGNRCSLPLGNVSGEDLQRVYYYSIFPNMLLSLHPDYVVVHQILPQSPSQTRIVCEWLFDPQAANEPNDAVEFWDINNREDWQVCELMQAGVSSRVYTPGPYVGAESLVAAIDRELLTALGEELPEI